MSSRQMNRRAILAGAAALAPAAALAAAPTFASPDAELLALGERLRAIMDAETAMSESACSEEELDAFLDAHEDTQREIVRAIMAMSATTLAGVYAKVVAIEAAPWIDEPSASDRLIASLLADLQVMGASS